MTSEPAPEAEQPPPHEHPTVTVLRADDALRLLLVLYAVWTIFAGIMLTFVQGPTSDILSGAFGSPAAQRLLGAHLLVLGPIYLLIAWRLQQYRLMLWAPYAAQIATFLPLIYDTAAGNIGVKESILPFVVSGIFFALFVYVWVMRRQALAPEIPVAEAPAEVTPAEEGAPAPESPSEEPPEERE